MLNCIQDICIIICALTLFKFQTFCSKCFLFLIQRKINTNAKEINTWRSNIWNFKVLYIAQLLLRKEFIQVEEVIKGNKYSYTVILCIATLDVCISRSLWWELKWFNNHNQNFWIDGQMTVNQNLISQDYVG